ncbi:SRPBCC family protein [Pseudolabrys sp. Root1462]|uniref:SRPBCC family protein n=1 Tax=Pseudolabrys sp. Root1462 TaxID=1736466 RepID=UPI0009E72BC3|nr:SRPBCC family protein [Pseudolabrys sp. Root1462]
MAQAQRAQLHKSGEIPAPAHDVWMLLTDWAGMLRWSLSAKRGGPLGKLVKCELIGEPGQVPRTRRMILDSGVKIEEELVYQNDETRRIYYRKTDSLGSIGYIATSYVDEIDALRCRLHIASWFDVEPDEGPAASVARFEGIYAGIFEGFRLYFSA